MIGDRWGVTDSDVTRFFPCDDFVASPGLAAWRGVRVEAPAAAVWPWVAQVRLAPYSYDWIDNLGRRAGARPGRLAGSAGRVARRVNGSRKLTLWGSLKIDPLVDGQKLSSKLVS